MSGRGDTVKAQVVDKIPKRFKELKFGIQSTQQIVNQATIEVSNRVLYDIDQNRRPTPNGALDPKLGTSSKTGTCDTCGEGLNNCNGHFGHIRLALPAFHIGYLKLTIMILQNICKGCAKVLLTENDRRDFLRQLRKPGIDNLKRTQICKKINEQCRKAKICPYCSCVNGQIRKVSVLKLVHDKYVTYNKSTAAKKVKPISMIAFEKTLTKATETIPDVGKHIKKAYDELNPLRVLNLFKMITSSDCELLNLNPAEGRPEMFLWQYIPAPPICIRPSVAQDNASTEDDITTKLADIVHINSVIKQCLVKGQPLANIMESWEFLQVQIAMYVNSDVPGLQDQRYGKPIRGFCQRLKGKQGRFRGNLSGKRVDFSARTVISPDPNLSIEQVAIPELVAKNMTYPERVTHNNLAKLKKCVLNGPNLHPGANTVQKKNSAVKISLKFAPKERTAANLAFGDIVERHLEDGDIVLFNRQPSLHRLSIMSHYVKVRPWRTFRLNECVCTPYNADFDGDEMNLHVPQTEEARTEAINLMGVKNNLSTPKNGEPIIAATQDFITAAYLLSSKENFFDRKTFTNLCMYMVNGDLQLDLPPPAIVKPEALWTGKQVFSMLLRPNKQSNVVINLDAKCRDYRAVKGETPDMDPNDGWLVIRNSEVMCGRMDKTTVGPGKKDSIFYIIDRDFGPDAAVVAMDRLSKISARYLTNQGFSIGISDVYPSETLQKQKQALVDAAYALCDGFIKDYAEGNLETAPGCNLEETLENKISGILSKVRQQAGDYCIETLSKWNSPLIMARSGSKGSNINVAQMVATVGQQMISNARVQNGFQDRTLPHFPKNSITPPAKGFVKNSFFSGLRPTEFLFHAISGREGLVDTAVKTAETGYMSRRLMKSLEDLSVQYDTTVRNSSNIIVQFQFGADQLDPLDMEGSGVPVRFDRTWTHAEALTWNNEEDSLFPYEIGKICEDLLAETKKRLVRKGLLYEEEMAYDDKSEYGVDEHESERDFLTTITKYVDNLADRMAKRREKSGLPIFADGPGKPGEMELYKKGGDGKLKERAHVERVSKVSRSTLTRFIELCLTKYRRAHVEPGQAVGAVGAQSIGEPGTQMTLKTFHFAGVAGMSITQGVPRIKEIINASKVISTPVITCPLMNNQSLTAARVVKARIEKTYVKDVIRFVEDMWSAKKATLCLSVDTDILESMQLGIGVLDIYQSIMKNKKLKIKNEDVTIIDDCIFVNVTHESAAIGGAGVVRGAKSKASASEGGTDLLLRVNYLKRSLPEVMISGYETATRAIIQTSEETDPDLEKNPTKESHEVFAVIVEGYGLQACMNTEGVVGTQSRSNSVMEMKEVLGIEAARTTIAKEIQEVMNDMDIDPRHMQLLADVMTYKGEVLGITRFGLSKMRDSVLQLASFEKTPDHLFEAAAGMKTDRIEGVSESIIMGQTMGVGTGAFGIVQDLKLNYGPIPDFGKKPTVFEDEWKKDVRERRILQWKKEKGVVNETMTE